MTTALRLPAYCVVSTPTVRRQGRRGNRGISLVEVMVSSVVLAMVMVGILATFIASYRIAAKSRYRDHARYVIKSLGDQFLTQAPQDSAGNTYTMFQTTTSPTGTGLVWQPPTGAQTVGTSTGLTIQLGDNTGAPISATVTRNVSYLSSSGAAVGSVQNYSAGYLLSCDLSISYNYPATNGTQITETLSLVRSVP